MKRITAFAMFLIMVASLFSCGGEESRIEELENQVSALQEQVGEKEAPEDVKIVIKELIDYYGEVLEYTDDGKAIYIKVLLDKPKQADTAPNSDDLDYMLHKFNAEAIFNESSIYLLLKTYYEGFETLTMDFETFEGVYLGNVSMNVSEAEEYDSGLFFPLEKITEIIETWEISMGEDKIYTFKNMSFTVDGKYKAVLGNNGIFQIVFEQDKEFIYINFSDGSELAEDIIDTSLILFAYKYIDTFKGENIAEIENPLKIDNPAVSNTFTHKLNFGTVKAHLIIVYDGQDFYYIHYIYEEDGDYAGEIAKILNSITFAA